LFQDLSKYAFAFFAAFFWQNLDIWKTPWKRPLPHNTPLKRNEQSCDPNLSPPSSTTNHPPSPIIAINPRLLASLIHHHKHSSTGRGQRAESAGHSPQVCPEPVHEEHLVSFRGVEAVQKRNRLQAPPLLLSAVLVWWAGLGEGGCGLVIELQGRS